MYARRWLLTGLTAAAVAGGLLMGDLTASAIDPYYRQVDVHADDAPPIGGFLATQPAPVAFTPISSAGEWPDAAPPPPAEHAFDEPAAPPAYAPAEPVEDRFDAGPEPVPASPSEPPVPAIEPTPVVTPPDPDRPVEPSAPSA